MTDKAPYSHGSAAAKNLQSCHHCGKTQSTSLSHCQRCGSHLHIRIEHSLQKTWALLITSIILYIPANQLPIMSTYLLGRETPNTILGGVITLWSHGSYPIALVIFIASVLVPIGKILALCWLCLTVHYTSATTPQQRTVIYRITEFIGRWSMVDVFVVAVLVGLIQMGKLMSIYPGPAALAFAGVVILTMLAAMSFDPRLIWDVYDNE